MAESKKPKKPSNKPVKDPNVEGSLEIAAEARFQAQCFLLRNISSKTLRNPTRKYSEFAIIDGSPNRVMNALTSRSGVGVLLDLTSAEIANLVPFIKIFKMVQNDNHTDSYEYLFPFSKGSFIDKKFGGSYTTRDVFKNRNARGADAGIESVDFELLATQPAEVTNHIKCTVNLYFRNLSVLDEKIEVNSVRGSKTEHISYKDLILRSSSQSGKRQKTCADTGVYDPADYRIKLQVGWNKIKNLQASTFTGKKVPNPDRPSDDRSTWIPREMAIRRALEKSELTLQLTLKKHTFKFNPDGSVALEIEYHAWAEGALSSPASNIFYLSPTQARLVNQLEAAKKFRKQQHADLERKISDGETNDSASTGFLGMADSDREDIMDDIEGINEKITEIKKINMSAAWGRFMNKLLPSNINDVKIYHMRIPAYKIGAGIGGDITASGKGTSGDAAWGGFEHMNSLDTNQLKRRLSQQWNRRQCRQLKYEKGKPIGGGSWMGGTGRYETVGGVHYDGSRLHLQEKFADILRKHATGEGEGFSAYDTSQEEAIDLLEKVTPSLSRNDSGDNIDIHFFFLGDLINVTLKILNGSKCWKENPAHTMTLLTGPMSFPHPCDAEDTVSLNVADIPISLTLFTGWFIKKIISKQKSTYLLRNFINDVIGELVAPALGDQCTAGAGKVKATVSSQVYTVRTNQFHKGSTNRPLPPLKAKNRYSGNEIFKIINDHGITKGPDARKVREFPYLFLYSTAVTPATLKCNRKKDEAYKGIYHFDFGRSNGVIYKMDFEKNDAPYLGEAKVTGKNNVGADLGGGSIYNVTIEMFGNSVFWPGQYIYVNPGAMDISGNKVCPDPDKKEEEQSIAYLIRMGGYYIITKVEGTLSRGQYTTKITARWETTGGPKAKSAGTAKKDMTAYKLYEDDPAKAEEIRRGLALADADEYDVNPE